MIDDLWIFLRGALVGVIVAAPIGPVGLVCMRTTFDQGRKAGAAVGLGAALADIVYAALAAFGLAATARFLLANEGLLSLVGGSIMLILAGVIWFNRLPDPSQVKEAKSISGSAALGFTMAFTNPLTVLGFAAVFVIFGLSAALTDGRDRLALVAGVAVGSIGYWLSLAEVIARTHHVIPNHWLVRLNHGIAVLLALFGLYALFTGSSGKLPMSPDFLSRQ